MQKRCFQPCLCKRLHHPPQAAAPKTMFWFAERPDEQETVRIDNDDPATWPIDGQWPDNPY